MSETGVGAPSGDLAAVLEDVYASALARNSRLMGEVWTHQQREAAARKLQPQTLRALGRANRKWGTVRRLAADLAHWTVAIPWHLFLRHGFHGAALRDVAGALSPLCINPLEIREPPAPPRPRKVKVAGKLIAGGRRCVTNGCQRWAPRDCPVCGVCQLRRVDHAMSRSAQRRRQLRARGAGRVDDGALWRHPGDTAAVGYGIDRRWRSCLVLEDQQDDAPAWRWHGQSAWHMGPDVGPTDEEALL